MSLEHIFNFVYVGIMMIGLVTFVFIFLASRKMNSRTNRIVEFFFLAILIYMFSDYMTYYYISEGGSERFIYGLITLSDTLSIVMMCAWHMLVVVTGKCEKLIPLKLILAVNVIYTFCQEGDTLFTGGYSAAGDALTVEGIGTYTSLGFSIIYYVFIIATTAVVMVRRFKRMEEGRLLRVASLAFSGSLIIYSLWLFNWDYTVWFQKSENLSENYAVDPIFIIYVVLCAIFMVIFMKMDLLNLKKEEKRALSRADSMELFCNAYEISARERDVLVLLDEGASNPEIAEKLMISENTVKKHVSSIMHKADCKNRVALLKKIDSMND